MREIEREKEKERHKMKKGKTIPWAIHFQLMVEDFNTYNFRDRIKYAMWELNVLFNDALNTFYLGLYGIVRNAKGPLR